MDIIPLILQLVFGAGAGVAAGKLAPRFDEGILINAAIGAGGGFVFGQLLGIVVGWFVPETAAYLSFLIASVVGGLAGGAILPRALGSVGRAPMARVGTRQ